MKRFLESLLASAIVILPFTFWFCIQATERPAPAPPNPGVLIVGDAQMPCVDAKFHDGVGVFSTLDGRVVILSGNYTYFERGD